MLPKSNLPARLARELTVCAAQEADRRDARRRRPGAKKPHCTRADRANERALRTGRDGRAPRRPRELLVIEPVRRRLERLTVGPPVPRKRSGLIEEHPSRPETRRREAVELERRREVERQRALSRARARKKETGLTMPMLI